MPGPRRRDTVRRARTGCPMGSRRGPDAQQPSLESLASRRVRALARLPAAMQRHGRGRDHGRSHGCGGPDGRRRGSDVRGNRAAGSYGRLGARPDRHVAPARRADSLTLGWNVPLARPGNPAAHRTILRRMKNLSMALALVVVMAPGCKKNPPPAPPHVPVTTHTCRVAIHPRIAPASRVSASGNAPSQDVATELAWTQACLGLPAAQRAACRDSTRFSPSVVTASMSAGAGTSYTTTVTLSPQPGSDSRGAGTSHVSSEDACHQAMELACRAAGAAGDCVAAGTHEESSRMRSSERQ